jgi:hypothetical protein
VGSVNIEFESFNSIFELVIIINPKTYTHCKGRSVSVSVEVMVTPNFIYRVFQYSMVKIQTTILNPIIQPCSQNGRIAVSQIP